MAVVSKYSWFNGAIVPLETGAPSVASVSFHLGTGVFDGMMAYWNRDHYYVHRGEEHLARFQKGAEKMGLRVNWSIEEMLLGIQSVLEHEPKVTQYVRPIAYRRGPELWITGNKNRPVDVSIFTVQVERDIDAPISCHISPVERISGRAIPAQIKVCGAYVNSFNARHTAELAGFQDAIMLDRNGRLTEASAANLFLIRGRRMLTPTINADVFPGITRKVVLEVAKDNGIDVQEADLWSRDLSEIDGAFLCSTLMEIRALSVIDEHFLETKSLPEFRAIVESFRKMTHQ